MRIPLPASVGSLVLVTTLLTVTGCAPTFQDARLVGPGNVEVTPNLSGLFISDFGETHHTGNQFGAQLIAGAAPRVDMGVAYARFEAADADAGTNLVGFGPKVSLKTDRVALALPFGFAFGGGVETSESFVFQPTGLFTVPITDRVDFNPAAKLLIPFCDDCDLLVGFNVGVGIRPWNRVTIRPEIAFLFNPGESGTVWSTGVGVSFRSQVP